MPRRASEPTKTSCLCTPWGPLTLKAMSGHHHDLSGDKLRSAAKTALEAHGEQWTTMRASIYDALAAQSRPTSAYDIADSVSQARGKRVAPNSVYRILDLFVASNLATRVESANAYIVNAHPGCEHDCIFLVCKNCGVAIHSDDDSLTSALRAKAQRESFAAERVVIEVQGRCDQCATAA